MSTSDPTVLYVMGFGRSGSTVLNIALGNHPEIQAVGELQNVPVVAWGGEAVCSCGVSGRECEFWEEVRARFRAGTGDNAVADLVSLDGRYRRARSFPRLMAARLVRTAPFRRYVDRLDSLYRAISVSSGKRVIVDASKHPNTAYALLKASSLNVRVIHLIRDGRAVLWSACRLPNIGFDERGLTTAPIDASKDPTVAWMAVNLVSSFAARAGGSRACRITYEDLVQRPRDTFGRIGRLAGLDLSDLARSAEEGEPWSVGHLVAGNRIRGDSSIRFRADFEWKEALDGRETRKFWRKAGWLAARYGYGESDASDGQASSVSLARGS